MDADFDLDAIELEAAFEQFLDIYEKKTGKALELLERLKDTDQWLSPSK